METKDHIRVLIYHDELKKLGIKAKKPMEKRNAVRVKLGLEPLLYETNKSKALKKLGLPRGTSLAAVWEKIND